MTDFLFSRAAQVNIQGVYALNFISLTKKQAEFEIIGFSDPAIRLIDIRSSVRKKTADVLKTGHFEQLAQHFNQPALIKLSVDENGKLTVWLGKTRAKKIRHVLWVAIGVGFEIPYYADYARLQAEPYEENTFALFYLFRKPKELLESFSES